MVRGLFAPAPPCLVVVRASKEGLRRYALICGGEAARVATCDDEHFRLLLEAESRQRPHFHGTTRSGTTYSGFIAAEPTAILDILNAGAPRATGRELCAVFAGEPWRLPRAIAVPLPARG